MHLTGTPGLKCSSAKAVAVGNWARADVSSARLLTSQNKAIYKPEHEAIHIQHLFFNVQCMVLRADQVSLSMPKVPRACCQCTLMRPSPR